MVSSTVWIFEILTTLVLPESSEDAVKLRVPPFLKLIVPGALILAPSEIEMLPPNKSLLLMTPSKSDNDKLLEIPE